MIEELSNKIQKYKKIKSDISYYEKWIDGYILGDIDPAIGFDNKSGIIRCVDAWTKRKIINSMISIFKSRLHMLKKEKKKLENELFI